MTQPPRRKLLKNLEDVLRVSVVRPATARHAPRLGYGESMIRHARNGAGQSSQAYDEVEALKAGRFGQVSVVRITAPGMTLFRPHIAVVNQSTPACACHCRSRPATCLWNG